MTHDPQTLAWLDQQDAHLALNHAVELIGKVDANLAIKVQAATDFGTGVGMSLPSFTLTFPYPRFASLLSGLTY